MSTRQRLPAVVWFFLTPFLYAATICAAEPVVEPYTSRPTAAEMAFVAQWKSSLLRQGQADSKRYVADLPFSFRCAQRSSREWVKIETANIKSGDWQDDQTRTHTLRWKDDQTSLACEMKLTEFRELPAIQWVVQIRNDGPKDSAKVHDFWGIDTYWHAPDGAMPVLHRSVGSLNFRRKRAIAGAVACPCAERRTEGRSARILKSRKRPFAGEVNA